VKEQGQKGRRVLSTSDTKACDRADHLQSLLECLIGNWNGWETCESYYLTDLLPRIVLNPGDPELDARESALAVEIKALLPPQDWANLPLLARDARQAMLLAGRGARSGSAIDRLIQRAQERRLEEALARRRAEEEVARELERRQAEAREREEKLTRERLKRLARARERKMELRREEKRRAAEAREREEAAKLGLERKRREELSRRRNALIGRVQTWLWQDYLRATERLAQDPDAPLLGIDELDRLRASFVSEWARRQLNLPLDSEQAGAAGACQGDVLVVARAGSGKTRTLVARAAFLQEHCGVAPSELLLLAFNKKAAAEIRERIAHLTRRGAPHVMTFHALAYALVHPEEQLVFDRDGEGLLGLAREVQEVIDEHVRSEQFRQIIREAMLTHFRGDWERIVNGRFELEMKDLLKYRRSLPRETLRGDLVKSAGEKLIANVLFENGIEYRYEPNRRWNEVNYRPDFTLPRYSIAIEYFGLSGDPDYDEMSEAKKRYWARQKGWRLLALTRSDVASRGGAEFPGWLLRTLGDMGVRWKRLSEREIWELCRRRAVDQFSKAARNFVGRARKLNLSSEELEARVAQHVPISEAERLFLQAGASIYRGYLHRLKDQGIEDFDGLLWRAVECVRRGQATFRRDRGRESGHLGRLRFVLVDEFQDFTPGFAAMLAAIRTQSPEVRFFCVGDDWQAINRFAGSDLTYFTEFSRHFEQTSRRVIRKNYRSTRPVIALGNALMAGLGEPAVAAEGVAPGPVPWRCSMDAFVPEESEEGRFEGDEITPATLRLVRHFLKRPGEVALLSRRNHIPWFVRGDEEVDMDGNALERFADRIRSFLPETDQNRVVASTAHGFKGLESAAVIVLDGVRRSYPLLHPTWVFLRLFGDSIEQLDAEERRLFYVALTRARRELAVITEAHEESPFLELVDSGGVLRDLNWEELPPLEVPDDGRVEVRVYNGFDLSEILRKQGFRFVSGSKYWTKSFPAAVLDTEKLRNEPWASGKYRIEIRARDGRRLLECKAGFPEQT